MSWTPTNEVINGRAIVDNLMAFFEMNQEAALAWVGDGSLKLIKKFSASVANRAEQKPIYPAISFADDNEALSFSDDVNAVGYRCRFEFMIQHSDPDKATRQARVYENAFKSMIANVPRGTLLADTNANAFILDTIESGFAEIRAHAERRNDWMQIFDISPTWKLYGPAF